MLTLSNLSPNPGSRKPKKRVGRGQGSGHGGTSSKGHKGANARSGRGVKIGFEGGQMPLQRRLPKRGFNNSFKKSYTIIDVELLEAFASGSRVDRTALVEYGILSKQAGLVKILANGEISKPLIIMVDKVSAGARQKIEAAGGTVEEI